MFCPQCSAENKVEQKFCRQCGLPLRGVRLALEGRLSSGVDLLKKDFDSLAGGVATLGIFVDAGQPARTQPVVESLPVVPANAPDTDPLRPATPISITEGTTRNLL